MRKIKLNSPRILLLIICETHLQLSHQLVPLLMLQNLLSMPSTTQSKLQAELEIWQINLKNKLNALLMPLVSLRHHCRYFCYAHFLASHILATNALTYR